MAYTGSTAAILSNYTYVLKTFYLPTIREQINNATVLLSRLKRNTENVSGKNATIAVHYGRNLGTRAAGDGSPLPDADYQRVIETIVPMKYNYGRITVSGPTIRATRDERGAYAKAVDYEMKGLIRDMSKDINRQLCGCGYGIIARWQSTSSGTSYVLQKAYVPSAGGAGFGSTFGSKYMLPEGATGMACTPAVYSAGATILTDGTDIAPSAVTVASTGDTITVTDPSVTEAAGTVYVKGIWSATNSANTATLQTVSGSSDGTSAAPGRREMMGLWGIVNDQNPTWCFTTGAAWSSSYAGLTTDGSLQSLDADTYSWWRSTVKSHSSGRYQSQRALTTELMQEAVDAVEEQLSDDSGKAPSPTIIFTTRAIRRKYVELLKVDKRFVDWKVMDGGYKVVEFNGIPIAVDTDAVDGEMYFLYEPALSLFQMSDLEWMEEDGHVLTKIAGYDAYEAILFWYAELGAFRRNVHAVITDLDY